MHSVFMLYLIQLSSYGRFIIINSVMMDNGQVVAGDARIPPPFIHNRHHGCNYYAAILRRLFLDWHDGNNCIVAGYAHRPYGCYSSRIIVITVF